jgi:hypothetical protein
MTLTAAAAEISLEGSVQAVLRVGNDAQYPTGGVPLTLPYMEPVLLAFTTTQSELNAVANLAPMSLVHVVVVDTVAAPNAEAVAWARSANRADVDRLQQAIMANRVLSEELEARRVHVTSVVAADFTADGVLVLYAIV